MLNYNPMKGLKDENSMMRIMHWEDENDDNKTRERTDRSEQQQSARLIRQPSIWGDGLSLLKTFALFFAEPE
jgi:hypothetical protein